MSKSFHATKEYREKMSLATKGEKNGFYGKRHSEETKRKMRKRHKEREGIWRPNWKGGTKIHDGYILIRMIDHPFVDSQGYVPEHRLVAEKHLGRHLRPSEVVHHRNGNKANNNWENLFVFESNYNHLCYEQFLHKENREQGGN